MARDVVQSIRPGADANRALCVRNLRGRTFTILRESL